MLALVFEVAGERYGVPARQVLEVVPRPEARSVPGAPDWIAGLFARGEGFVPIVDLVRLLTGEPCPVGASSRVAIVERARGRSARCLGLLAPGMTRVLELTERAGQGLHVEGKEFLGAILLSDAQGVQLLDASRVLPPEVDELLFGAEAPA